MTFVNGITPTGVDNKLAAQKHVSADITDATSAPTENVIVKRDSSGRAQVDTPSSAKDIVNKEYVDNLVDWNNTLQGKLWGHVPIFGSDNSISAEKVWIGSQGGYAASENEVDDKLAAQKHVSADVTDSQPAGSAENADKLIKWGGDGRISCLEPIWPDNPSTKNYVDTKDTETLNSAKTYTDTKVSSLVAGSGVTKIEVVSALPASPVSTTLYVVV